MTMRKKSKPTNESLENTIYKKEGLYPYYIIEILKDFSDEDHPMTQTALKKELENRYSLSPSRTTIDRCLHQFLVFEPNLIVKSSNGSVYYNRKKYLDAIQFGMIMSAVISSKFIPVDEMVSISTILSGSLNRPQRIVLQNAHDDSIENMNEAFQALIPKSSKELATYPIIETITEAIKGKKQVSFSYGPRGLSIGQEREMPVIYASPHFIFPAGGNIYLLCSKNDTSEIKSYRIDMIDSVVIEKKSSKPIEGGFDIVEYVQKKKYLSNDDCITAKFIVHEAVAGSVAVELFGNNVSFSKENGLTKIAITSNEAAIFGYTMSMANCLTVIEPTSLIYRINEAAHSLTNRTLHSQVYMNNKFVSLEDIYHKNRVIHLRDENLLEVTDESLKKHFSWALDRNKAYWNCVNYSIKDNILLTDVERKTNVFVYNLVLIDVTNKFLHSKGLETCLDNSLLAVSIENKNECIELKFEALRNDGRLSPAYKYFKKRISNIFNRYESLDFLSGFMKEILSEKIYFNTHN